MWTCRRWLKTRSVGDMLSELEWPSLKTHRERSSLSFFYKINSGTMCTDKEKYLIFTLYFAPTTKTKSKKGHNLAKILQIITNIELDFYFTMIYPSANFQ